MIRTMIWGIRGLQGNKSLNLNKGNGFTILKINKMDNLFSRSDHANNVFADSS
jgi:hypothetical protein